MAKAVRRIYVGEENKATPLSFLPVGFMCMWPSTELPKVGTWLERNGSILTIEEYPELFAVLGYTFGGTEGSTFALPDDRGLVERGWDNARGFDAARVFGSQQGDAIRDIYGHVSFDMGGTTTGYINRADGAFYSALTNNVTLTKSSAQSTYFGRSFDFYASRVVPVAAENRMKNRAYLPIIKVA